MSAPPEASRRIVRESCPLCDATSWTAHASGDGFEWVRCACGCVFKRSEPTSHASRLSNREGSQQWAHGDEDGDGHYDEAYFARYERRRRHRVAKSRRQIRDALEVAPPGRLLDVGCSLGYTLEAAKSLGLDAVGLDVSEHAVEACTRLGFEAHLGGLDALPFEDASFSIVMLKHVFEHTPTPRRTLAELRRVLVPNGALFLAVPNLDYFKAARSPATSRFFRGEGGEAHYVYYTSASLSRVLEKEGFRVMGVHPRLVHRREPLAVQLIEALALPIRAPLRAIANAAGLRKEFWLVAVRP